MARVTLREVARRARVSIGTVSMVLNESPLVAEETRARVREVLDSSGYVYNRRAASLRRRTSDIVGISISNLSNPYFAELVAGAEGVFGARGKAVILSNAGESMLRQEQFARMIREHDAGGLLLVPAVGCSVSACGGLLAAGLAIVFVSRRVPGVEIDYAGIDNVAAGELATEHLWSLGHRDIGFIGTGGSTSTGRDRLLGYRRTLRARGVEPERHWSVDCAPVREAGFEAVTALLSAPRRPTAAVCFNDQIAFGAMLALRRRGLTAGRDFGVVGVDGTAEAALWMPALTTVAASGAEVGAAGAELLLARMADRAVPPRSVILRPTLIVRGSSDPAAEQPGRQRPVRRNTARTSRLEPSG